MTSSRTTGLRFSSMVSDRRVSWSIAGLAVLAGLIFFLAVKLAPEQERIFRTNPEEASLLPAGAMETSPETQVKAAIFMEKEAALEGDVEKALRLWDPNGVVRDARNTQSDASDDSVWAGIEQVRRRYQQEFARHHYLSLHHADASVVIEGDSAVVINDLDAVLQTPSGTQRVLLARGDRWTLVRGANGWRIRELVLNRSPR
jgi:ketosteroid isomerase-like protein